MKLLLANQRFGAFGGAETHIQLCASELQKRGHRLGLLYGETTGRAEAAWHGLFPDTFRLSATGAGDEVRSALARFQPDLIYVHNLDSLPALEAIAGSGVPFARMVHDHTPYCLRTYKYNYFTRKPCSRALSPYCLFPCLAFVARNRTGPFPIKFASYRQKQREMQLMRQAQRLLTNSDYCRAELIRNGCDPERIVLHSPVAPRPGNPQSTSSFSDRNLVLFAGQIIRGKGVDLLLRALARVRQPFECVILGTGSHRAACEKLCAQLGLEHKVHFAGFLPPEVTEPLYLEATVFAVTSVWPEPFGLVGPEAMRFGLPVVGFNAGGISEWLIDGENGFLVPWMDTQAFAAKLDLLLSDKNLARTLGAQGRQRVDEHYNARQQFLALEELFGRVICEAQHTDDETHSPDLVHGHCH
jgi:glycosyltransferase involved in cell wall biosynthesis